MYHRGTIIRGFLPQAKAWGFFVFTTYEDLKRKSRPCKDDSKNIMKQLKDIVLILPVMMRAVKLMAKTKPKTMWMFTWFMLVVGVFLVSIILALKS